MISFSSKTLQTVIIIFIFITFTNIVFCRQNLNVSKSHNFISSNFIAFEFLKNEIISNTNIIDDIYIPINIKMMTNEFMAKEISDLKFMAMDLENILDYLSIINDFKLDKEKIPDKMLKKAIWIDIYNKSLYSVLTIITYPLNLTFIVKNLNNHPTIIITPNSKIKQKQIKEKYIRLKPVIKKQMYNNKFIVYYRILTM